MILICWCWAEEWNVDHSSLRSEIFGEIFCALDPKLILNISLVDIAGNRKNYLYFLRFLLLYTVLDLLYVSSSISSTLRLFDKTSLHHEANSDINQKIIITLIRKHVYFVLLFSSVRELLYCATSNEKLNPLLNVGARKKVSNCV